MVKVRKQEQWGDDYIVTSYYSGKALDDLVSSAFSSNVSQAIENAATVAGLPTSSLGFVGFLLGSKLPWPAKVLGVFMACPAIMQESLQKQMQSKANEARIQKKAMKVVNRIDSSSGGSIFNIDLVSVQEAEKAASSGEYSQF